MKSLFHIMMTLGAGWLMLTNGGAAEWQSNPEAAVAAAKAEGRTVLLEFTGSDWCPPCKYLRSQIFPQEAFQSLVEKQNLVLVELDFPRAADKLTPEQRETNETWRERYNVMSFPTVLVVDGTGAPYAAVGGMIPSVDAYLGKLNEALQKKRAMEAAVQSAQELSGVERARALAAALDELPAQWRLLHRELVDDIMANDPEDVTGYRKLEQEVALLDVQRKELEALYEKYRKDASSISHEEAIADAKGMLGREDLLPVVRLQACKFLSDTYAMIGDIQHTHEYLKAAIEAAPDSQEAAKLRPWLENLERHMAEGK